MHGPPLEWKASAESPGTLVGWVEISRPTNPPGGPRRLDPPYKSIRQFRRNR